MFCKLYACLESLNKIERNLVEVKTVMECVPPIISTCGLLCKNIIGEITTIEKRLGAMGVKLDRLSDFYRHIGFITNYPKLWQGNYEDIIGYDFPAIRKSAIDYLNSLNYLHPVLQSNCIFSFENESHAETIRNAFLAFKTYAVRKFGLPENLDGQPLCDKLFSESGIAKVSFEKSKEYNAFTKALYGYFRNKNAHYLTEIAEFEAETVLMSLNLMLQYIDNFDEDSRNVQSTL